MLYRGVSWKLILANAALIAVAIGVGAWMLADSLARSANEAALARLRDDTAQWTRLIDPAEARFAETVDNAFDPETRVALVSIERGVISARGAGAHDELLRQPELRAALDGDRPAAALRNLGGSGYLVVAIPLELADGEKATLWLARPQWTWSAAPGAALRLLLLAASAAGAVSLALAMLVARLVGAPLRRIADQAARLNLSRERALPTAEDLPALAKTLADAGEHWNTRFDSIQRQRATFESLVAQIREGVVVSDQDGRIVIINPAAVRLLQLAPEDHSPVAWCRRLPGSVVERAIPQHDVLELLRPRRTNEPPRAGGDRVDEARLQVDTKDGVLHVLARGSDLLLPAGEDSSESAAEGRVVVLTDISELTRTTQVKTDFVANASHELRTPLSTIRASVEALQMLDFATEQEAAARFLGVIDRQSTRLAAMVSDLLDLSRLESQALNHEPRELQWNELAVDLEERFRERAAARGLRFQVSRADDPREGRLSLPPYLLELALDNLVDNALKFTPAGGEVRVTLTRRPGVAEIEVRDTGCGIPLEDQERVFERFYQVERARSGPDRGTGLGLSIVRHAVLAMDGEVGLESVPGRGTRFTMRLPQRLESPVTSFHESP
ncbi:MAG: PAS domain-containing protein [Planctomycetia bacterium]|nr:MAG: PAS domain-containing protein [Planctomycetia bacterium]